MKSWTTIVIILTIQATTAFSIGGKFYNGGFKDLLRPLGEKDVRVGGGNQKTISHAGVVVRSSVV